MAENAFWGEILRPGPLGRLDVNIVKLAMGQQSTDGIFQGKHDFGRNQVELLSPGRAN